MRPVGPVGPVRPVRPGGRVGPVRPVGPLGPVGPVGPVGPAGPVGQGTLASSLSGDACSRNPRNSFTDEAPARSFLQIQAASSQFAQERGSRSRLPRDSGCQVRKTMCLYMYSDDRLGLLTRSGGPRGRGLPLETAWRLKPNVFTCIPMAASDY